MRDGEPPPILLSMCGIGGIVSWSAPVAAGRLDAIEKSQAHRGPDGSAILDWGWAGFAHRRLAIIDVAHSAQPMTDPSGRFALTYNGEIFNFRELRAGLEARGHVFRTPGDVEVLLRLLMEEGEAGIPRLEGQFAFAFADREKGVVLLARDRLGIKPLHFARRAGELVFASEIRGILAAIPRPAVRPESVDLFLTLRYVPSPWTIFEGVAKLRPGELMTVHRDGRIDGPRPWFRVDDAVEVRDRSQEEIEAVLRASVRAELVSDVPLGVLLSGGIDSSTVAVLASEALAGSGRLKTVTAGFADPSLDERPHARAVAAAIRSDHAEVVVDLPDSAGAAAALLLHFDEPFADTSVIPSDALFRAARSKVKVALGGDGGDELFLGYRVYHRALTAEIGRRARVEGGALDRLLVGARRSVSSRFRAMLDQSPVDLLLGTRTIVGDAARRRLYRGTRLAGLPDPLPGTAYLRDLAARAARASGGDPLRALMLIDLMSFLPECCLVKVDRMSMRHGLEVRVPLLGNAVLALGLSLPTARKAVTSGARRVGGKRPLRELLARKVPALDVARRKQGFGAPAPLDGRAPLAEWCDPEAAAAIVRGEPVSGVRSGEAAFALASLAAFSGGSAG